MAHTLSETIIIWSRSKAGQQVGAGECWDLANQALKKAHALSSEDLGPMDADADYVWGAPVQLKDVIPGDVLQFRDFSITTTVEGKR
jgi:hypothetical protein